MKKIITLLCVLASIHTLFAQTDSIDAKLQKIIEERNDENKIKSIYSDFNSEIEGNPNLMVTKGIKLLQLSQKKNDLLAEGGAYYILGCSYRSAGNKVNALNYTFKGLELAEKIGNQTFLIFLYNNLGNIYKDAGENERALSAYLKAIEHSKIGKNDILQIMPVANMGTIYLNTEKLDSALIYAQKAYELTVKTGRNFMKVDILRTLGGIHSKMGNELLAKSYFIMAVNGYQNDNKSRSASKTYFAFAEHFNRFNQRDSCIFYAKKAIEVVDKTALFYLGMKPAKLLSDIYTKTNCDSALKYSEIYRIANDSFYSAKIIQQTQLITFENEMKQKELAEEKIKAEEEHKQNIQYALIAFGIITFIISFLLLSRRFITNTKMIQFLGVVALLVVFEFLNLLLHPFLERITHHSPMLMLLALVCIAALLVPLHHKLEKWATHKLVEKNKAIRLASAKKTIEELEEKG